MRLPRARVILVGMGARAGLLFAAMAAIWGVPYLFIKIAVDGGAPPALVAWSRTTLAAALLLTLAARAGTLAALRGRMRWVAAFGLVEVAIPFPLIALGEQHVPSSLTAILIASLPLMIALFALRFDAGERPTPLRLAGLLVGFAGVVTLMGLDLSGTSGEVPGALAILGATLGYAIGPMIVKHRLADLDPRATMGASLAAAALMLAPLAAATAPGRWPDAGALGSIVALGVLCTAVAFVLYSALITDIGPARAAVITYVNPVVAVGLGVALLGERPGAGAVAGLLLILAGSWLSTGGGRPPRLPVLARRRLRWSRSAPHRCESSPRGEAARAG